MRKHYGQWQYILPHKTELSIKRWTGEDLNVRSPPFVWELLQEQVSVELCSSHMKHSQYFSSILSSLDPVIQTNLNCPLLFLCHSTWYHIDSVWSYSTEVYSRWKNTTFENNLTDLNSKLHKQKHLGFFLSSTQAKGKKHVVKSLWLQEIWNTQYITVWSAGVLTSESFIAQLLWQKNTRERGHFCDIETVWVIGLALKRIQKQVGAILTRTFHVHFYESTQCVISFW